MNTAEASTNILANLLIRNCYFQLGLEDNQYLKLNTIIFKFKRMTGCRKVQYKAKGKTHDLWLVVTKRTNGGYC